MLDRKTRKQKSFAVQKSVPVPENISFLSSCLQYLPIEQLFEQQRPVASRYTTQQVYSKPRINRKPYQVYLNRKYTIASPKTINNTKKSIREGKVQFGQKVTSLNVNLQKIGNDAQRNKIVGKLIEKSKKPKNSIKQSKLMRVKSLELQPDSLEKKYPSNPKYLPKKIQSQPPDQLQYSHFKFKSPQKRPVQKIISNLNVNNPYTPKKMTNFGPIFTSAPNTPKIKTYHEQHAQVKRIFYQSPISNQQKISQPITTHKIDVPHKNLVPMPSKQNLQNDHKPTQYSSEKTQRKRSVDDDSNFIYRDLKKIQLKEEQKKTDDNIKQIIKSKFKALDLSSTKKQKFHQSGKLSINDHINQKKEQLQIKILNSAIEKYQNEEAMIDKQPNMQLQMLKKSSISNGQFAKPIISKYHLPQSNIVQSKYHNNFLNPQYSDLYTDARRFGGSQVSGNLNPISSKKNLNACLGGLSSMTVNSYMQSVRQSKVVHKVQESVVMMDFFNPPKQPSYST